ncbi:hypothetical protein ACFQZ8_08235 [Micromonospora azadirachtae]|uniref:Uncharacterized protein n=1 Tax=Micromonospora azadirachtae TaxID=1970735 RepID=A0ABW3A0K4_9ACTN
MRYCHTGSPSLTAAAITDLIWAYARPADGVEHLRVRLSDRLASIVIFVRAAEPDQALVKADSVVRRAAGSPVLRGYEIL